MTHQLLNLFNTLFNRGNKVYRVEVYRDGWETSLVTIYLPEALKRAREYEEWRLTCELVENTASRP